MDLHNNHLGRVIGSATWWLPDSVIARVVRRAIDAGAGVMLRTTKRKADPGKPLRSTRKGG